MVGIDLGTTNSLVAVMRGGSPEVLSNELEEQLTPSMVAVASDGELLVGRAAKDRLAVEPDAGVSCFKRDMGTQKRYRFGDRDWSPTECSAVVLKEMKRIAELHLGEEVSEAVITVPAYFHDEQRQATLEAAEISGLKVKRLINEPTAAALAFGYRDSESEKNLFVFDLGGGTFDVTLLEIFDGIIEVKASGGVSRLGGEDYTDAITKWVEEQASLSLSSEMRSKLRQQVELAKRRLTRQDETSVTVDGEEIKLNQESLSAATGDISARIRPVIKKCLRDAGESAEELDDVLLVGGASRMPLIVKLAAEELQRMPNQTLDPDKVIALGAAVQSALIDGDDAVDEMVLTDVCSHTLGVETTREIGPNRLENGYFSPLIDRNTTVPVSRADVFNTLHPQQDEVNFRVFQGEGRMVADNRLIGEVNVKGLRHRPGQEHPGIVEVRFTYDMNGILEVEATILESGKKVTKIFEQRPGTLTKREIEDAIAKLAPLKIHPRDKLPNRARIERANRMYEELIGPSREHLAQLVLQFEAALEAQDEEQINVSAAVLDSFMNPHFREEGEFQGGDDDNDNGKGA